MDVRALEVFCKIVELGSFSRAAEAVFLTQPTVSGHIKALEGALGLRLFDRAGRRVTPTKAGELLHGYARRILALRAEAEQAMASFKGGLSGTLTVGASSIPGGYILPSLVARFKERAPGVSLVLRIGDSREIVRGVAEGDYEMGVVGARFEDRRLHYERFLGDELVLAVPRGHPWAGRGSVRLAAVAREPFVMREVGSGSRKMMEKALADAGVDPADLKVVAEMGNTEAVRRAVKAGAGVAIISRRAVEEDVKAGGLAVVAIQGRKMLRDFYIVTHRSRSRSPVCKAFIEFLQKARA